MGAISVRDAAAEYSVPATTLSGWIAAGLVRVVREPSKRGEPKLISKQDVAALAQHYEPGRGHWNRRNIVRAVGQN